MIRRPGGGPIARSVLKHPWLTAAAAGAALLVAAAIVVVSGIAPITASSGHWPITAWLLDFAKVRSVATHSIGIEAPRLDDSAMILRGAGHFEIACAPCHGAARGIVPPVMTAMTPPPPELPGHVGRWTDAELFYIVKHGIKFTGMPAWPDQRRDDEVWAAVAFLRRLPDLDADGYRALAYGAVPVEDSQVPQVVRDVCARCHGLDGQGRLPGAFPSLAGQRPEYLHRSLRAFADGRRSSGTMRAVAAALSEASMRDASLFYAALPSRVDGSPADADLLGRGETIARLGAPERDIPACITCHGPREGPRNPAYPDLSGQHVQFLRSQLRLFQERRRGGSGYENLMHVFAGRLRPEEVAAVTAFYATQRGR